MVFPKRVIYFERDAREKQLYFLETRRLFLLFTNNFLDVCFLEKSLVLYSVYLPDCAVLAAEKELH